MRSDPEQPCKRLWPLPESCICDSNFLSLLSMDSMLPPGGNAQIFGGWFLGSWLRASLRECR